MSGLIKVDDIQSNTENEKIKLHSGLQDPSGNTIMDLVSVGSDNYYHNFRDAGIILNSTTFTNSTRTGVVLATQSILWEMTINKLYNSSFSDLIVFGQVVGTLGFDDTCGVFAHIFNSTSVDIDGSGYYDVAFVSGTRTTSLYLILLTGKKFQNLEPGEHTLQIGWISKDPSIGLTRPFEIWNPNSTDIPNQHQTRSQILVQEIKK